MKKVAAKKSETSAKKPAKKVTKSKKSKFDVMVGKVTDPPKLRYLMLVEAETADKAWKNMDKQFVNDFRKEGESVIISKRY